MPQQQQQQQQNHQQLHHHQQQVEIDIDPRELETFAERFKQRRIKLGVTQADVGHQLSKLKLPGVGSLSQSTICRFESLTLSHNNMIALKPVLQSWLEQAEADARQAKRRNDEALNAATSASHAMSNHMNNGGCMSAATAAAAAAASMLAFSNGGDAGDISSCGSGGGGGGGGGVNNGVGGGGGVGGSGNSALDRKRKRTSIAAPEKRSLESYFSLQPRPSGEKIAQIAEKLDLKKNVVRVWFCNQRQKQKREFWIELTLIRISTFSFLFLLYFNAT